MGIKDVTHCSVMFVYYNMYKLFFILLFVLTGCSTKTINNTESPGLDKPIEPQKGKDIAVHQVVEAACGQCQFGLTEKLGCDLAVRIDGKTYFVDGTNIHEHGDAHADDGFCEVIRNANVKGKIIDGRFKSESFTLTK